MRCRRCNAATAAQVSLLHAAHPIGEFVGWVAIALSIAGIAWAIWSASHGEQKRVEESGVVPVAYASVIGFFAGVALVWRNTAATRPRW